MTLTSAALIAATAEEIRAMASDLRRIERHVARFVSARQVDIQEFQVIDPLLQRMDGLARILATAAAEADVRELPDTEAVIASLRLQSLSIRFTGQSPGSDLPCIDVF